VLIHDGARCLVEPELLQRCAAAVSGGAAVIAATPVTDTIKQVDGEGTITATPDRRSLWAAQTRQRQGAGLECHRRRGPV
jgi:2-C-methyl-D-erythritol 4-phosphate cytidylyltransferase